jgi:hypothetical protein
MVKPGRKSIWGPPVLEQNIAEPASSGWSGETPQAVPQPPAAVPIVEQLRLTEKKQRDRGWEKKGDNRTTSYRGVPPKLQAEIRQVAVDLQVTVDDVARAFLEFGLQCYLRIVGQELNDQVGMNGFGMSPHQNLSKRRMSLRKMSWLQNPGNGRWRVIAGCRRNWSKRSVNCIKPI